MYKTSNHSNGIAGRAVTCSVSVIHFLCRNFPQHTGDLMTGMLTWALSKGLTKDGGQGRLTLVGNSWLPLRLPFCGIHHRDGNRPVKTVIDNDHKPIMPLVCFLSPEWTRSWALHFKSKGMNYSNMVKSFFFLWTLSETISPAALRLIDLSSHQMRSWPTPVWLNSLLPWATKVIRWVDQCLTKRHIAFSTCQQQISFVFLIQ